MVQSATVSKDASHDRLECCELIMPYVSRDFERLVVADCLEAESR